MCSGLKANAVSSWIKVVIDFFRRRCEPSYWLMGSEKSPRATSKPNKKNHNTQIPFRRDNFYIKVLLINTTITHPLFFVLNCEVGHAKPSSSGTGPTMFFDLMMDQSRARVFAGGRPLRRRTNDLRGDASAFLGISVISDRWLTEKNGGLGEASVNLEEVFCGHRRRRQSCRGNLRWWGYLSCRTGSHFVIVCR